MNKNIKVNALQCSNCGDIIFSRAVHDFRSCTCEECFVDGGFEYFKYGGEFFKPKEPEILILELNISKKDLYKDWNHSIDRYGLIKKNIAPNWIVDFKIIKKRKDLNVDMNNNFTDIGEINKKKKTDTEYKIEKYIDNIPENKVSTPVLLAEYLEMTPRYIKDILRNKFKKNIKKSNITKKLYIGKSETLENLE